MKKINIDGLINFNLFIYILSLYLFTYRAGFNDLSNILAASFVFLVAVRILTLKKKIVINKFIIVFFLFIIMCLISAVYSINQEISITKVQTLFFIFILIFFLINYIDTEKKFFKTINYFIYSGFIASLYILFNSDFTQITRFGSELGNVNAVGLIIGISLLFGIGKIMYDKNYVKILFLVPMIITILLTGSRKSLLFVLISFFIIYYLKNNDRLTNKIKVLLAGVILMISSYYIVIEIPFFYQVIGIRMENLFSFFTDAGTTEASMNVRSQMITFGLEMFKSNPFWGYGIDNYRTLFGIAYFSEAYSHNNFVELLVGVGVLGAFLYYYSNIVVIKELYAISKSREYNTLYYTIFAIIIGYLLLGTSLVYYDSKHFSIILALGCVASHLKHTNLRTVK